MKWEGRRQSDNVEDRRGAGGPKMAMGGGLGVLVILVVVALLGGDPMALLQQMEQGGGLPGVEQSGSAPGANAGEDELAAFVGVVLADTEDVWKTLFQEMGERYEEPKLVLFSGQVRSACGFASSASGPFYCPADRNVYIDLVFYKELKQRFGAPGDFAQAYVIAHEVGHHVQNLLGISDNLHAMRGRVSEAEYNRMSVRLELQADFFAGVWAHHADRMKGILEKGDVEEALGAANAIGDDTLQRQTQGHVVPDSFTHGSSEQRMRWFLKGLETGDLSQGDTFSARDL